jgi:hypothetical protein
MPQNIPNPPTTPPPPSDVFQLPATAVTPDQLGNQLKNLEALQDRAMKLELRVADLGVKVGQLQDRRNRATEADRPSFDAQWADAQHDMTAASIELSALHGKISQIERSLNPQASITLQPPFLPAGSPFLDGDQILQFAGGAAMLLLPLVLVLARNLWVRGGRRGESTDIESSPRLQRMEQAIEAIAVEVERIGEAQRFTMKVLSDRPAPVPLPAPKREAGSITPH